MTDEPGRNDEEDGRQEEGWGRGRQAEEGQGQEEDVTHVVQFSTGVGSAEVAYRVAQMPGEMVLLTADTLVEDEDNWRFAREVVDQIGCPWVVLADGRTPMEVGRDHRCVPNNRMAVCSRILKRELLREYLEEKYDPASTVIHLGFDWTETNRWEAAARHWEPWTVACPLMDPPHLQKAEILDAMRARGIEPPRLYVAGFPHANCGGACVRAGQVEWRRLLHWNRERYLDWESEEEHSRSELGKNVTILRDRTGGTLDPLSLRDFRERLEDTPSLFDHQDYGACGCMEEV